MFEVGDVFRVQGSLCRCTGEIVEINGDKLHYTVNFICDDPRCASRQIDGTIKIWPRSDDYLLEVVSDSFTNWVIKVRAEGGDLIDSK